MKGRGIPIASALSQDELMGSLLYIFAAKRPEPSLDGLKEFALCVVNLLTRHQSFGSIGLLVITFELSNIMFLC